MTMYYSEVDGAEPTVSIQIKGVKYTFTNESLINIVEQKDSLKEMLDLCQRSKRNMAGDVKAFFEEVYTDNETDMTVSVEDVNQLLVSIGADPFTKSWSATVTITATITGVEASTKDEVEDIIKDNIDVNFNEDGDLWVDDINVDGVHPES
jgi:hypothetical protein